MVRREDGGARRGFGVFIRSFVHRRVRLRQDGYDGESGGLSVGAGTTEEPGPSGAAFSGSPSCKKQGKSF